MPQRTVFSSHGIFSGVEDTENRDSLPEISVLTPSYNYGRFLSDCIESLRSQGQVIHFEHLIQDCCSEDSTREVVESFLDDSRLHFFRETDDGQSDALNKALKKARGEIIGWLNADEFYLPGAFEAATRALRDHPDADGIFGDCVLVSESGEFLRLLPGHQFSRYVLENYGAFISSCTTFLRADAVRALGWDSNLTRTMDWDLWLRASEHGKLRYVPFPFAAFRVHSEQVTFTPENLAKPEFDYLRTKHGISSSRAKRFLGRLLHVLLKLKSSGYFRQISARKRLKGGSMRWWVR